MDFKNSVHVKRISILFLFHSEFSWDWIFAIESGASQGMVRSKSGGSIEGYVRGFVVRSSIGGRWLRWSFLPSMKIEILVSIIGLILKMQMSNPFSEANVVNSSGV